MPVYLSTDATTDVGAEDRTSLNDDYVVHHPNGSWEINVPHLFTTAFEGNQSLTGAALRYKVKTLANIATNRLYNNSLNKAMAMNLMQKSKDGAGRVVYTLNCASTPSLPF